MWKGNLISKVLTIGAIFLLIGGYYGFSITITITATGDNYLYYYNWNSGGWEKLDAKRYNSWKKSASLTLDWSDTWDYLVFAVKNRGKGSWGNGAGFLAQIDLSTGDRILSDENWEVFPIASAWSGVPDFDVLSYFSSPWQRPEWYAYNSGGVNPDHPEAEGDTLDDVSFWYKENKFRSISGIALEAKWIWTDYNFSTRMDKGALFRIRICSQKNIDPLVPEPSSLVMLLVGVTLILPKRRCR